MEDFICEYCNKSIGSEKINVSLIGKKVAYFHDDSSPCTTLYAFENKKTVRFASTPRNRVAETTEEIMDNYHP